MIKNILRGWLDKLTEEAREVIESKCSNELLEELSDLLEVMLAIAKRHKISLADIDEKRLRKLAHRGGFEDRVYVDSIEMNEDHPLFTYFKSQPSKYPEEICSKAKKDGHK